MTNIDPDIWTKDPTGSAPTGSAPAGSAPAGSVVAGRAESPIAKLFRTLRERALGIARDDRGMSTVEYALGTVAAAAFGALLYTVVTGGQITDALTDIIERALNTQ